MLVVLWAILIRVHAKETLFYRTFVPLFLVMCMSMLACVSMCIWMQGHAEARRGHRELEIQAVVSHPRWVGAGSPTQLFSKNSKCF